MLSSDRRAPAPRAFLIALLAVLLAVPVLTPRTTAVAEAATDVASCTTIHDARTTRISGADRWATAACVARTAYPDGASTVILARGDTAGGYADALAGTVLANALHAPILLTSPDTLPAGTRQALDALAPVRVIILGGTAAVGDTVAASVTHDGRTVERVQGETRAHTAVAIADRAVPGATSAFLVNGHRPADALVAGAVAARAGAALLLVDDDSVPDVTRARIAAGMTKVTLVGGFGVVGTSVDTAVRSLVGTDNVTRLGGADRRETAASIARALPTPGPIHLVAAADRSLVDAIGAGWRAALDGGPVLYSGRTEPGRGTDRHLRLGGIAADSDVRLIGGTNVLADMLVDVLTARRAEAAAGGPAPEMRAMWIHLLDDSLKSPEGIETVIDAATRSNLNTIIVQAVRRHDAFSSSDVLPRTTDEAVTADFDLLDLLLPAAHARGLDVHVWYSVMPSRHPSMDDEQLPAGHVNTAHGPNSNDPWVTTGPTHGYDYLDPGIPGVQDHVVAMVREVVERHDVDGVHLDYLRYASPESGFHPTNVARFNDFGGGGEAYIGVDEDDPEAMAAADALEEQRFNDWRRAQTEDLVRRIYVELAEEDRDVVLSMAAIAQAVGPEGDDLDAGFHATRAYAEKFQDWATWFRGGFMDVVFPMAYFDEALHPGWYDQWVRFAGHLDDEVDGQTIAIGQASYLNHSGQSLAQIDEARAATNGVALYSYQGDTRTTRGVLLDRIADERFTEPAPVPEIAWRVAPADGHVLALAADGDTVVATPMAGTSGSTRTLRADATGHAAFVHLAPGFWQIGNGGTSTIVEVTAGDVVRTEVMRAG